MGTGSRLAISLAAISAVIVPTACGNIEEQSLCPAYAIYLTEVSAALESPVTDAATALTSIDKVRASLSQLRTASDSRFVTAIDDLDETINDMQLTLESVESQTDYATWAPLVEDTRLDARDAQLRLSNLLDPQCTPQR